MEQTTVDEPVSRTPRWLSAALQQWNRSLKIRTMTITGLFTGVMILISGTFILTSVSDELFTQRRDEVLQDAARATTAAQTMIDTSIATDERGFSSLGATLSRRIQNTSSSQMVTFQRQQGQEANFDAPQDFSTNTALAAAITPELTEMLVQAENPQYWQSIQLVTDDGTKAPGMVVASTLTFPSGVGVYNLYIGYSFADVDSTYAFISRTLLITALFLMLLIGVLVMSMTSFVFRPIRVAAEASRRLAAGEEGARMSLQDDEYFDILSENFNDMAETLQTRIDELDTLSQMQQRFVSDVSHELRTPLTTLKLAAEVLASKREQFEPGQSRAVEVMSDQVDRFEALLGDLLEISRYDAGQVSISTESTNIVRLTEEVVASLQPLSASVIEVRPIGGYSPIEVDPRRIRRIISNLVGNAIEHGEGNPIVVTIDSNAQATALSVRDWGIGMEPESADRVFERFWRADPARKRTLGGTGLGLAIAREDAAVHGGLLEVWSKPGVGTNFRLTLPRHDTDDPFISPLPLIPEEELGEVDPSEHTGGWLQRPARRRKKAEEA